MFVINLEEKSSWGRQPGTVLNRLYGYEERTSNPGRKGAAPTALHVQPDPLVLAGSERCRHG